MEIQVHQGSPYRFERNHREGAWERPRRAYGQEHHADTEHQTGFWKTVLAAAGTHPEDPAFSNHTILSCEPVFHEDRGHPNFASSGFQAQPTSAHVCPVADADICRAE